MSIELAPDVTSIMDITQESSIDVTLDYTDIDTVAKWQSDMQKKLDIINVALKSNNPPAPSDIANICANGIRKLFILIRYVIKNCN